MEHPTEHSEAPQDTAEPLQEPPRRPYRAKGPTLGKGKACEYCRYRRIVSFVTIFLTAASLIFQQRVLRRDVAERAPSVKTAGTGTSSACTSTNLECQPPQLHSKPNLRTSKSDIDFSRSLKELKDLMDRRLHLVIQLPYLSRCQTR